MSILSFLYVHFSKSSVKVGHQA